MADNKIIYADKLQKAIVDDVTIKGRAFAAVMRHLQAAPAVEARPVVRGRWIVKQHRKGPGDYTCSCSVCKTEGSLRWICCPVCTAWMNGGAENDK